MTPVKPLPAEELYHPTDPKQFDFETTAELEELTEVIGQPRAVEAMRFGVGIEQEGYNLFALGPAGTGKRSLVRKFFEERAKDEAIPSDWCYVNNFDQAHKPYAISLPAGQGNAFCQDMEKLVEELRTSLAGTFESEEYQARRQEIQEELQGRQEQAYEDLRSQAREQGLSLLRTPGGLVFAPLRDGEVLSPEEYQSLPEEERTRIESTVERLQVELQKVLNQVPRWQRDVRERVQQLNREIADLAVGSLFDELRQKYESFQGVVDFLVAAKADAVDNVHDFLPPDDDAPSLLAGVLRGAGGGRSQRGDPLRRYEVNLLVDNSQLEHAPVIYEDNPINQNLIGSIEYLPQLGALVTDFNMIRPGALHRANGGYLLLDARKLLLQPFAWESLKRALEAGQIKIESPASAYSLISTVSLDPEPIPLDVKIALLGEPLLYYLLSALDPEFGQLFKVMVDFDEQMVRSPENQAVYARLIATLVQKEGLRAFDRGAVARVIEHGARMVGDSERLTTRVRMVTDLLREADYWAGKQGNGTVQAEDVQRAIDAHIYRSDRMRERMQEAILRETILIDTEGEKVGQVNGLSVLQLGDFAFGQPSRITARVRLGEGEVVNIEREVELSGPIHSKGVLILAGFLGARYASDRPLSLSASLVFEQSYGGVEGDSASSTELYALLSAIAEVPIRQSLAVTGSVNQHGEVQAIGGANEKIEGFFDICRQRGLTGEQGVLIPASNVKNLMLRADVIEAVQTGTFHIYPVRTINEGIELLTGVEAGEQDEEGRYPEGTINARVQARLETLAEQRAKYSRANGGGQADK